MSGIAGLLTENKHAFVGEPISFLFYLEHTGDDASLFWNLGDRFSFESTSFRVETDMASYALATLNTTSDVAVAVNVREYTHVYRSAGNFVVAVDAINGGTLQFMSEVTVEVLRDPSSCLPDVKVVNAGQNVTTAPRFKPRDEFTVTSTVALRCTHAAVAYAWFIYRLPADNPFPVAENLVAMPTAVAHDRSYLAVPRGALAAGHYIVKVDVTVTTSSYSVTNSDQPGTISRRGDLTYAHTTTGLFQGWIFVEHSPLVALIRDGSSRSLPWEEDVTVDGSISYDPDTSLPDEGLLYTWYCHEEGADLSDPDTLGCYASQTILLPFNTNIITIPKQALPESQTVVFVLELSKPGRESQWAQQLVMTEAGELPAVAIACAKNCGPKVKVEEKAALVVTCSNCNATSSLTYTWSMTPGTDNFKTAFDFDTEATFSSGRDMLIIKWGALREGDVYTFRVVGSRVSGASGFAEYTLRANTSPVNGDCTVSPSEGTALVTDFEVHCDGFWDDDLPLSYEFYYRTGAEFLAEINGNREVKGTLLYYSIDPYMPPTILPPGIASRNHLAEILVLVADSYKSTVWSYLNVTVHPMEESIPTASGGGGGGDESSAEEAVTRTLKALTVTTTDDGPSRMQRLVSSGDMQAAAQLINVVTAILNSKAAVVAATEAPPVGVTHVPAAATTREPKSKEEIQREKAILEEKAEIRTSIVKALQQTSLHSLGALKQTSSMLSQVTAVSEEVSPEAQVIAVSIFEDMGKFVKTKSQEHGIDDVELLDTAKARRLAMSRCVNIEDITEAITEGRS
ncbi:PREDICTED: sperm receptor for egg jelly-like [Priapulus caudatus]|uniref:Sperm receptor for egg jelly-like n=1 Tax=Priapulus caudatus TaxID=37621 RepID=A0ABM1FAS4_PRICU|nr:PREDICTED: sperm receptor for egg jelly-like [Priapulus caudatus]